MQSQGPRKPQDSGKFATALLQTNLSNQICGCLFYSVGNLEDDGTFVQYVLI